METPKFADELKRMPEEPLLPIEKKLVAYSLVLGIVLLVFLVWLNHEIFG